MHWRRVAIEIKSEQSKLAVLIRAYAARALIVYRAPRLPQHGDNATVVARNEPYSVALGTLGYRARRLESETLGAFVWHLGQRTFAVLPSMVIRQYRFGFDYRLSTIRGRLDTIRVRMHLREFNRVGDVLRDIRLARMR
ncbi:MAG: hypothetical protein ACYDH4_13125, partial [Candidatus Cryosericum sp.]